MTMMIAQRSSIGWCLLIGIVFIFIGHTYYDSAFQISAPYGYRNWVSRSFGSRNQTDDYFSSENSSKSESSASANTLDENDRLFDMLRKNFQTKTTSNSFGADGNQSEATSNHALPSSVLSSDSSTSSRRSQSGSTKSVSDSPTTSTAPTIAAKKVTAKSSATKTVTFPAGNNSKRKTTEEKTAKLVLAWTKLFGDSIEGMWQWSIGRCRFETRCNFTDDRTKETEDAVVFHMRDFNANDLPKKRRAEQLYVFFVMESHYHTPTLPLRLKTFFNTTVTFRQDSTAFDPYGYVWKITEKSKSTYEHTKKWIKDNEKYMKTKEVFAEFVRNKTKKVAWFVSNCGTNSKRETYVNELKKHIKVDQFGGCNGKKCGAEYWDCNYLLRRKYKFYLSMENSVCRDYVTEKFFQRASMFTIPLVLSRKTHQYLGDKNTSRPVSFIAADDFRSVKELAEYLKYLDGNTTAYMEYFSYRHEYEIEYDAPRFCNFCPLLWEQKGNLSIIPDINSWWHGKSECVDGYAKQLL